MPKKVFRDHPHAHLHRSGTLPCSRWDGGPDIADVAEHAAHAGAHQLRHHVAVGLRHRLGARFRRWSRWLEREHLCGSRPEGVAVVIRRRRRPLQGCGRGHRAQQAARPSARRTAPASQRRGSLLWPLEVGGVRWAARPCRRNWPGSGFPAPPPTASAPWPAARFLSSPPGPMPMYWSPSSPAVRMRPASPWGTGSRGRSPAAPRLGRSCVQRDVPDADAAHCHAGAAHRRAHLPGRRCCRTCAVSV